MGNLVEINNGKVVVSSLQVAERFGKRHADVLESIKNLDCSEEFSQRNFPFTSYKDGQNKERPMYLMTRDGFSFLVMGFTGKEAAHWKEEFIKAFNAMEEELKNPPQNLPQIHLPQTYLEALKALVIAEEEKLLLEQKIQEDAPKVDYYEELVDRNCLINLRDTAKEFNKPPQAFNDWLVRKKLLYRDIKNQLKPYAKALTDGFFELKEYATAKSSGTQTMVTPKGRSHIQSLLKKEGTF